MSTPGLDNYKPESRTLSRSTTGIELDLYAATNIMNYLESYAKRVELAARELPYDSTAKNDMLWIAERVTDHAKMIKERINNAVS